MGDTRRIAVLERHHDGFLSPDDTPHRRPAKHALARAGAAVPIQSVGVRVLDEDADEDEYEEIIFVYEADTARMVPVRTGIQDDEYIHITEGLQAGTDVISGPYSAISKELDNGTELRKKEEEDDDKERS